MSAVGWINVVGYGAWATVFAYDTWFARQRREWHYAAFFSSVAFVCVLWSIEGLNK